MSITTAQVKEIRTELAKLKPEKITLDGNRSLSVKEAVFALAPTLERMRKRGFDTQENERRGLLSSGRIHPWMNCDVKIEQPYRFSFREAYTGNPPTAQGRRVRSAQERTKRTCIFIR